MIRRATQEDIPAILRLLEQVLAVHHQGRPDLFREKGTKYSGPELAQMLGQADAPIFVLEESGRVAGYLIGQMIKADGAAQVPVTTFYVDDLCVDEAARGKGIGRKLMEYARDYAAAQGCHQPHPPRLGRQPRRPGLLRVHGHENTVYLSGVGVMKKIEVVAAIIKICQHHILFRPL